MNEITHLRHRWETESHHATSEGVVVYQLCTCGVRRVALRPTAEPVILPEIPATAG